MLYTDNLSIMDDVHVFIEHGGCLQDVLRITNIKESEEELQLTFILPMEGTAEFIRFWTSLTEGTHLVLSNTSQDFVMDFYITSFVAHTININKIAILKVQYKTRNVLRLGEKNE